MVDDTLDLAGLVVSAAVLVLLGFLIRRAMLRRHGATLHCALRLQSARAGHGWHVGLAKCTPSDLQWFRVFSVAPQSKWELRRHGFTVTGRRQPHGAETLLLPHGAVVVQCEVTDGDGAPMALELAMTPGALTGFSAWLESAPPGAHSHAGHSTV